MHSAVTKSKESAADAEKKRYDMSESLERESIGRRDSRESRVGKKAAIYSSYGLYSSTHICLVIYSSTRLEECAHAKGRAVNWRRGRKSRNCTGVVTDFSTCVCVCYSLRRQR